MVSEKSLAQIESEINGSIKEWNSAFKKQDLKGMTAAEAALKTSEAEYLEVKQHEVFCELKKAEKPVIAAVTRYSFPVLKHKTVREDGIEVGIELTEKERQIDLVKFCKFCELDTSWAYKVEKFGQLLCLRAAKELNMSAAEIKQIASTYYMKELARKENLGETPTSNTQIVKALQKVVDTFMFEAGDNGANVYKVNNHDVAYLLMCYTKRSNRKELTVQVSKTGFVHALLMDICHRIVTGGVYGLDYRQEKAKPAQGSEPKKESKPVAKKADVKPVEPEQVEVVKVPIPQKAEKKGEAA